MKDRLPNRIMNVWHWEDGQKGLDRMVEFSEYIALSLPELRALKKTKHAVALANYIKNKKPTIDIHLLGTCANKYLEELSFCTSADSTNWQEVNRWGHLAYKNGKGQSWHVHNSQIKEEDWSPYIPYVERILPEWGREVNDQRRAIKVHACVSCINGILSMEALKISVYLAALVLANFVVFWFGKEGLYVTAFLLIPFDFVMRSYFHEKWKGRDLLINMFILIVSAGLITFLLNPEASAIAVASASAFVCAQAVAGAPPMVDQRTLPSSLDLISWASWWIR